MKTVRLYAQRLPNKHTPALTRSLTVIQRGRTQYVYMFIRKNFLRIVKTQTAFILF